MIERYVDPCSNESVPVAGATQRNSLDDKQKAVRIHILKMDHGTRGTPHKNLLVIKHGNRKSTINRGFVRKIMIEMRHEM